LKNILKPGAKMAILLKRNATRDPWFSQHESNVKEGDIVTLVSIVNEAGRCALYPPEIYIDRNNSRDPHKYLASLSCYEYIKKPK
jgi:hypothetical protein